MLSPAFVSGHSVPTVPKSRRVGETLGYAQRDRIVSRWLAVALGVEKEIRKHHRKRRMFLHCPRLYYDEHGEHSYRAIAIRQRK